MNFGKVQIQFRIHNLEFRVRILQKVSDPCGSGSTTLLTTIKQYSYSYTEGVKIGALIQISR
jgi:hypothetical protein